MKAINIFVLNLLCIFLFQSCRREEQQQHDLDASTKAYFEIRDGSKFIYTETGDTSVSIEYTSSNFLNSRSNPDIENSEIMFYDMTTAQAGQPKYTIRCQSGGTQYKDQIALVTQQNDSIFVGPVIFNLGGNFSPGLNSYDSVFSYPTYTINNTVFNDVIRVKLYNHPKFREVFFAKGIGMVARKEKSNKFWYVKRYRIS